MLHGQRTWSSDAVSLAAQISPYAPWPTPFLTSYRSSTSKVVPFTTYCRFPPIARSVWSATRH